MIKILPIENNIVKLMPYSMLNDDYVIKLHMIHERSVLDDIDASVKLDFKGRIRSEINNITTGWVCWSKEPVVKIGIVYFSNVVSSLSAMFHFMLDIGGYKHYLRSMNGNVGANKRIFDTALALALEYMFYNFKLHRISGFYYTCNVNAINICKRLGFKEEGVLRRGTILNHQPVDVQIMGLIQEELVCGKQ